MRGREDGGETERVGAKLAGKGNEEARGRSGSKRKREVGGRLRVVLDDEQGRVGETWRGRDGGKRERSREGTRSVSVSK